LVLVPSLSVGVSVRYDDDVRYVCIVAFFLACCNVARDFAAFSCCAYLVEIIFSVDIVFLNVARNGHECGGKMVEEGGLRRKESEWSMRGR
jgi:hypothetical protein